MPVFANMMQGPTTAIKSIQRGTIALSTASASSSTAVITSVDMSKTKLTLLGASDGRDTTTYSAGTPARIDLQDATHVRVRATAQSTSGAIMTVSFEVTEYY